MPATPTNDVWIDKGRLNGAFLVGQIAPYEDDVSFQPVTERGSIVAQDRTTRIAGLPDLERENAELRISGSLGAAVVALHKRGLHPEAASLALAGEGAYE